jgi:uncharacterized membrane protein (UPF0127 family)
MIQLTGIATRESRRQTFHQMKSRQQDWAGTGDKSVRERLFRVVNLAQSTMLASSVVVADTSKTRRRGLLGRESLSPGEGLWIIPCESVHTIFMRFPIDLIYLDRQKRIKKLRSDVNPWRLSACFSADSVLELAAGSIGASRSKLGDMLDFTLALAVNDLDPSNEAYS